MSESCSGGVFRPQAAHTLAKGSEAPSTLRRVREQFDSEETQGGEPAGAEAAPAAIGDTEEIDALPVLADEAEVVRAYALQGAPATYWRSTSAAIPAVQAAAAAAGGFVAGAAVVRLFNRRHRAAAPLSAPRRRRRGSREKRGSTKAGELIQIVGSRSLLVDVHLLGGRD
jgi:hypothetical protein